MARKDGQIIARDVEDIRSGAIPLLAAFKRNLATMVLLGTRSRNLPFMIYGGSSKFRLPVFKTMRLLFATTCNDDQPLPFQHDLRRGRAGASGWPAGRIGIIIKLLISG